MTQVIDRPLTAAEYEELARAYYQTLPMEHFMESTAQATQRKIALESLDLLQARRPNVQVYSELLVQYKVAGAIRRVVPDNMVCLCDRPVRTRSSYNLELEPVGPFWVLEWVSYSSEGKDYGDAFHKYEHDLKVPYCLMFHPEEQDFRLHRHVNAGYEPVAVNSAGRYPIAELELELGLQEGWVRFWYQGDLLPLPADLQERVDELKTELARATKSAARDRRRVAKEKHRTEAEKMRADAERMRADAEKQRADDERKSRLALEQELARLRQQSTEQP